MDIYLIRLNNLKTVLEQDFRGKQVLLANAIGVSANNISRYFSGNLKHRRNISDETARAIETSTGRPFGWMDTHHGEDMDNAAKLLRNPQLVPLISWVTAGAWCESPDNYAPGDAEEWLPCPSRHSARTYALRVVGDSMTSQNPSERSYPNGTIIFVDPEKAVEIGSRVIVRLPNSSDVTFKTYTMDAGVPYLMPINSRYPTIKMPEDAHICGVVIGSYWPE